MVENLGEREALSRVRAQDALQQVQGGRGENEAPVFHHLAQPPLGDSAIALVRLNRAVHGRHSGQHDEQDDAQRPDIVQHRVEAHVALVREHL